MYAETEKFERPFLANWILVTSGAFLLALPVIVIVPQLLPPIPWAGGWGEALVIGAFVGCAQWFMLRKRIAVSGWWVLACAVGLGLPPLLDLIASRVGLSPHLASGTGGKILGFTSLGIIGGFLSGLLQVPLLKPHFANTGWWPAASSAGWGLCLLAASSVDPLITLVSSSVGGNSNLVVAVATGLTAFVGGLLFTIPLGVVTGVGFLWMARHSAQGALSVNELPIR